MRSFLAKLATVDEKDLTDRELEMVNYVKGNLQTIVATNMKIEKFAQEIGIGYSTIYGLLNKLNIKGYRDFSISLSNDADAAEIQIAKDDENVANGYISIIKQNYSLIEKKSLFDSLNLIRSAPRIFVSYWENVLIGPAMQLKSFFYNENLNVDLLDSDWDTINEIADRIQENDLFIFLTKYGTSKHLEKIILKIKNKGGKIIFISRRIPSTTVSKMVNIIHTLIADGPNIDENVIISKSLPFHYFNDLLIYHFINTVNNK